MRSLLLVALAALTCLWEGCHARGLPLVRELRGPSLHIPRDDGGHVQPKDGARQELLPCGEHYIPPGGVGFIDSENYPNNYPNSHTCLWSLTTSAEASFTLACDDFDVSSSRDCRADNFDVNDYLTTNYRFCGTGVFPTLADMSSTVDIRFQTDRKGTARGFSCVISSEGYGSSTAGTTTLGTTAATTEESTNTLPSSGGCTCGVRNTATRIVGGQETTQHEYPWQVALVSKGGSRPYCGGSVISDQWIMTASHCVDSSDVSGSDVIIGEHDWSTTSETSVTDRRSIAQVVRHPNYSSRTLDNDIALVKLTEPITFSSDNKIAPVCLPTPSNLYEAVDATITGWGTLRSGGSQPYVLNEVTVPTMSNAACKATGYSDNEITDNMICAGEKGKDSCQGDSGGPMVTGSGSMQQIGIVSWGYGCARQGYPGVYTRVGNYDSWIRSTIAGSSSCPPA